jgi:rhamnopyranosyl-N-acetylglucosaminyl-diphospho-decaprenol beta-1,3/1,4-galactofuranosyltransferase
VPDVKRRVVAVVVTWNRRVLLDRIVRAVNAQTVLPDELIVVDNASTDGSADMVRAMECPVPLRVVALPTNTGGAGGFHAGLAAACEDGAELVWLMDDDGLPPADCLARLLEYDGRLDFWGPAVVAEQDPTRLCFPIRLPGRPTVVHDLADVERAAADGLVKGIVIPFNGVLVTRELVERIGLPRREFFIWGDDVEYLWRAKRAGARVGTVVDCHFRHPATDDLGTPMAFGRSTYNHSPSDLKHYCLVRNNLTNLREYVGRLGVLAFVLKTVWFYSFTRPSLGRLRLSAEAARAARRGDFTGHLRLMS